MAVIAVHALNQIKPTDALPGKAKAAFGGRVRRVMRQRDQLRLGQHFRPIMQDAQERAIRRGYQPYRHQVTDDQRYFPRLPDQANQGAVIGFDASAIVLRTGECHVIRQ